MNCQSSGMSVCLWERSLISRSGSLQARNQFPDIPVGLSFKLSHCLNPAVGSSLSSLKIFWPNRYLFLAIEVPRHSMLSYLIKSLSTEKGCWHLVCLELHPPLCVMLRTEPNLIKMFQRQCLSFKILFSKKYSWERQHNNYRSGVVSGASRHSVAQRGSDDNKSA